MATISNAYRHTFFTNEQTLVAEGKKVQFSAHYMLVTDAKDHMVYHYNERMTLANYLCMMQLSLMAI